MKKILLILIILLPLVFSSVCLAAEEEDYIDAYDEDESVGEIPATGLFGVDKLLPNCEVLLDSSITAHIDPVLVNSYDGRMLESITEIPAVKLSTELRIRLTQNRIDALHESLSEEEKKSLDTSSGLSYEENAALYQLMRQMQSETLKKNLKALGGGAKKAFRSCLKQEAEALGKNIQEKYMYTMPENYSFATILNIAGNASARDQLGRVNASSVSVVTEISGIKAGDRFYVLHQRSDGKYELLTGTGTAKNYGIFMLGEELFGHYLILRKNAEEILPNPGINLKWFAALWAAFSIFMACMPAKKKKEITVAFAAFVLISLGHVAFIYILVGRKMDILVLVYGIIISGFLLRLKSCLFTAALEPEQRSR